MPTRATRQPSIRSTRRCTARPSTSSVTASPARGTRPSRSTTTLSMLAYTKTLAPGIGAGQYAYGAAITLVLIVIGIVAALALWRLTNMKRLLMPPKIEVQ